MVAKWLNSLIVPRLKHLNAVQIDRCIKHACDLHKPLHLVLNVLTLVVFLVAVSLAVTSLQQLSVPAGIGMFIGIMLAWSAVCTVAVRWSVGQFVSKPACECGYRIRGLEVCDGIVQCPECGQRMCLQHFGLTPEMLQDAAIDRAPA